MTKWGTVLTMIGVGGVAVGLWLFLGWVFGRHAHAMREAVGHGCTAAGETLSRAGDAVFGWARWCFARVEQAIVRFGERVQQQPAQDANPPPPTPAVANPHHALSTTIVALGALVLLVFVAVNGYLLFEITPDLFSFSPDDVRSGSGKYIAWLVPIGILAGEVIGGFLVKSERRRRDAGAPEASVKIAWMIFVFCYLVELAAGVRRAWAFLWVASPFANEATVITVDSAATAALWFVLAGGVPWVIFALAAFVEPAVTRLDALGAIIPWLLRFFRTVGAGLLTVIAVVSAIALFGGFGLATGLVGSVLHVLHWLVRYVILAIAVVCIVIAIQASWIILQRIREWRGVAVALLVVSGIAPSACSAQSRNEASHAQRTYATVQTMELLPTPSPESFDKIATVSITRYIGERHKVVRVLDPKIHVCLADVSASIRSTGLRAAVLEKCAALVSEITAEQGPETLGIVVPIVDAGLTSETPQERFERADVPTRCMTNPPIPQLSPRSTVADKQLQTIRAAYERAERECSDGVAREYGIARQARARNAMVFRQRVAAAFTAQAYPRTDIFGTLALTRELIRTERAQLGSERVPVRISIVSDLEDDANGCDLIPRFGVMGCPVKTNVLAKATALCNDPATRCTIHQVLQATLAARGRGFEAEKRLREERQDAWRETWANLSNHIEVFTFTAPVTRRPPPTPAPNAVSDRGDGTSSEKTTAACSGAETIRSNRAAMMTRSLNYAQWMAFGRALAACGPETKPWAAVGLASKDVFSRSVVLPFYNGDVARERGFERREPALHARIARAWGIE